MSYEGDAIRKVIEVTLEDGSQFGYLMVIKSEFRITHNLNVSTKQLKAIAEILDRKD